MLTVNMYRCGGSGNITIYQNHSPVAYMFIGTMSAHWQFNIGDTIQFAVDGPNSGWYWDQICHAPANIPTYTCDNLIIIDSTKTVATGIVSLNLENICLYTSIPLCADPVVEMTIPG